MQFPEEAEVAVVMVGETDEKGVCGDLEGVEGSGGLTREEGMAAQSREDLKMEEVALIEDSECIGLCVWVWPATVPA